MTPIKFATTTSCVAMAALSMSCHGVDISSLPYTAASYKFIASHFGSEDGIEYRYGPAATNATNAPTQWAANNTIYNGGNGIRWTYQWGTPNLQKDDYSGNQAQVIFVADNAAALGINTVQTLLMGRGTFSEKPEKPWVYYSQGGIPTPELTHPDFSAANGGPLLQPTATSRAFGTGWSTNALISLQSGLIVATGTNTSQGRSGYKLPSNKVPTAIAITPNNEFALVTVWDTDAIKGQVAVFALGSHRESLWWGNWAEPNPGLRNQGLFNFVKLLGYIDLPFLQPTEISATSDYRELEDDSGWLSSPDNKDHRYTLFQLSLSNENNRQSFVTGPNRDSYSKVGAAVIISKYERKAVVLDLKPLFEKVRTMYFTTRANYELTRNQGLEKSQWPYTFDVARDFAPTIVKTLSFNQPPTAVRTSLAKGVGQAYIATQEGTLHILQLGGYGTGKAAQPSDIKEIGLAAVGKNPTAIAYAKVHGWGTPDYTRTDLIVLSRQERKIDWVRLNGNTGSVIRTLRDSRMQDPIYVDDNDNHGTESYVITVADYAGKQLLNYRYGPIIYHTNGGERFDMGSDGRAEFEFGGSYSLDGKPFQVTGANVP